MLQMQVYLFGRQLLSAFGFGIKAAQECVRRLRRITGTTDGKHIAARIDLHLQALLDLLQMLVELAAQTGQSARVCGLQRQGVGGTCGFQGDIGFQCCPEALAAQSVEGLGYNGSTAGEQHFHQLLDHQLTGAAVSAGWRLSPVGALLAASMANA